LDRSHHRLSAAEKRGFGLLYKKGTY